MQTAIDSLCSDTIVGLLLPTTNRLSTDLAQAGGETRQDGGRFFRGMITGSVSIFQLAAWYYPVARAPLSSAADKRPDESGRGRHECPRHVSRNSFRVKPAL